MSFSHRFLLWCAKGGLYGRMDWPVVVAHAGEFAMYENLRPPSRMALAKSLTRLGVEKTSRRVTGDEHAIVSYSRSEARHPRVTVYMLPCCGSLPSADEPQADLFD